MALVNPGDNYPVACGNAGYHTPQAQRTYTSAGLLGMAILVSVVAVIAVTGISAVLAAGWIDAASRASFAGIQAGKLEGSAHAYIFSFGLENALVWIAG